MARIVRTELAQQDLEAIFDYLDGQSTQAAERFAADLEQACVLHAAYPRMGTDSAEYAPNLRLFTVRNYAIFYRPLDDGIEIIRIIHGARDIPRLFE